MDERVKKLKTPQDCERFAKNAKDRGRADLAQEARQKAVALRAASYGTTSEVERECLEAVFAYEETLTEKNGKKTKASRTWQMIRNHGILPAVERAVNKPHETIGYAALLEVGLEQYAFESVVVKYPSHFSLDAVERCRTRISKWHDDSNFERWMYSVGLSKSSVKKYYGAVEGVLSEWALAAELVDRSILEITNKTKFDVLSLKISALPIFLERNSTGHNMYSSALNKYSEFLADGAISAVEEDIEEIIGNKNIGETEKSQLISARIGQGKYRKSLLSYWEKCAVTGVEDTAMLVASHIKPWSKCSKEERLDQFNGLLLSPNLDRAFDQGLVSFSEEGYIIISPFLGDLEALGIHPNMHIQLDSEHMPYMDYHRKKVFKSK